LTLVDTSVWVNHFRGSPRAAALARLLHDAEVLGHRWVVGELALGSLGARRAAILADLRLLPQAPVVGDDDVLRMIDTHGLAASGIGWVDAHLAASTLLAGATLWTLDRGLRGVAKKMSIPLL
jgi:predicted nucleic acid-binding protein